MPSGPLSLADAKLALPRSLRSIAVSLLAPALLCVLPMQAATPAITAANTLFPSTPLGQSTTQSVTVTLNAAVALKSIALKPGFTEFKLGSVTGCKVDGSTVNAANTVCTIPVTFTPKAIGSTASPATARTAPLLVTDIESGSPVTYPIGLLGASTGPLVQFTPATLTHVAGAAATGYPAGDQGLGPVASGYAGDNGPATSATFAFLNVFNIFDEPAQAMAVDSAGNIFVIDQQNQIIRRIDAATNTVTTVVGTPKTFGRTGDGGPATSAEIEEPAALALDAADNIYFTDVGTTATDGSYTLRMVNTGTGIIQSIAGQNFTLPYPGTGTCVESGQAYQWEPTCGDGGLATQAFLYNPQAVAIDGAGNIFILQEQGTVRRVDAVTGIISTVGNAVPSGSGEAYGMAMGADGNLYAQVYDSTAGNEVLTRLDPATGITKTAAGGAATTNNATCTQQGTPAATWFLAFDAGPSAGVSADGAGNIYGQTAECAGENATSDYRFNIATGLAYAITQIASQGGNGTQNGVYTSFGAAYAIQPALPIADGAGNLYFQTYNQIAKLAGSAGAMDGYGSRYDFQTDAAGTICAQYAGSFCQIAVLANVGNAPLDTTFALSSGYSFLTLSDPDACAAGTIAPGQFCNIDVEFTPITAGDVPGTLTVADNADTQGSGQQIFALDGTGVAAPEIAFTPPSIAFAEQAIDTTSASQTVTISNPGTGPNTLDGIYIVGTGVNYGVFTITGGTCSTTSTTLAAGASCTVQIAFSPTTTGPFSAYLNVNNLVGTGNLQATTLSGTAVTQVVNTAAPVIAPAAGAYNAPVAVQITDATAGAVIYDTTDGTTPTTSLTPYSAPFTVSASSSQVQAIAADSGSTSPTTSATYTIQPYLSFSPAKVGVTSSPQQLTAKVSLLSTTTPTASLHYGHDYALGSIACTPNGAIEVCTIPVTFAPTLPGARKDALILQNGNTLLATILLGGTGQSPLSLVQPGVVTSPVVNNPNYIYGSATDENDTVYFVSGSNKIVSLTKAGVQKTLPITGLQNLTSIAVDGTGTLYIAQNTTGTTLVTYNTVTGVQGTISILPPPPYEECPTTSEGNIENLVSVAVDDIGNLFALEALCGAVLERKADGTYVVTALDPTMTQPATLAVDALDNVFVSGYDINKIAANGTQTQVNTQGGGNGIEVDAADTLYVSGYNLNSTPGVAELPASDYTTLLATLDNTGGLGESLASDGTVFIGNGNNLDKVDRSQGSINFGEQQSNIASAPQTVGIYNGGNETMTLVSFAVNGLGFTLTSPATDACAEGLTIAPGALCNVLVTLTAPHPGIFSGSVTFTTNSLNASTTQTVALSGFVYGAYLTAAPNPLNFGSLNTTTTSAPQLITLTNSGDSGYASIGLPTSSNPAFSVTPNTCANVQVQVGSSCQLSVTFSPTAAQPYTGTVSVGYTSNGGGSSQTVSVTVNGSGIQLAPAATPVITPGTGSYTTNPSVSITDSTPGATIYYTTDGSTPTTSSTQYTAPIVIAHTGTNLQAIAAATGYTNSAIALAVYDLKAIAPVFTPPGGTYTAAPTVAITSATPGAAIYYTTDGSAPTTESTLYTAPIAVTASGTQVQAIASLSGYDISPISSATYIIQAPAPVFISPVGAALAAQPVTVNLSDDGVLGSIQVLTQGASNLDFTLAPGGTCQTGTAYGAGETCTVNVIFKPQFPGARPGAIQLTDTQGYNLATTYLPGTGTGPQIVFAPGTQSTLPLGPGLSQPLGSAVDAAGNVYIADTLDNRIIEIPKSGTGYGTPVVLPAQNLNAPSAVAIDGSGNLYIADTGNFSVEKLVWNGSSYGRQITLADETLADVTGIAVDGNGNLFFSDAQDKKVFEIPWTGTVYGEMTTVTQATGLFAPHGIAFDANQNLYIANSGAKTIVELPATSTGFGAEIILPVSNLNYPEGVAVDGGGNVYVVDTSIPGVLRLPWSGSAFGTPAILTLSSLGNATGVTVDGAGNLYVADAGSNDVLKLDLTPPSLSFKSTAVGSTSIDSPQTVPVTNIGNASMTFAGSTPDPSYPTNFPEDTEAATLCSTSLPQGATCAVAVNFTPTSAGNLTGNVVLTDNTLNAANSTQSIAVSGSATGAQAAATPVITPGTGSYTANQTVTLSDSTAGAAIYYTTDGSTPTTNSAKYTAAFTVSRTGTIVQAIADATGYAASAIASATYTFNAITPVLAPPGGTYNGPQSVAITSATAGAAIYYTTNGTVPTTESTLYTAPISVTASGTQIQAIATLSGYNNSPVASGTYTIQPPTATLSPTTLNYGSQPEGSTSAAQTLTLKNTSPGTLNGIVISISEGSQEDILRSARSNAITSSADYAATTTCGATLAAGAACTIAVTFDPQSLGTLPGTVTVTDNASNSPQIASLTGTGTAPAAPIAALTPAQLTFTSTTGTTTSSQTATLKNTGNAPLSIASVTLAGTNPSDFSQTNTCGNSLAAGSSCTISVTFTPSSAASFTATLSVADNAAGSPQSTALTGTGAAPAGDFDVSATPSVQTVNAGGTATYKVAVATTPSGAIFSSAVTLGASGLPAGATVTFSPVSVTPGAGSVSSTLTIQTAAPTASAQNKLWPTALAAPSMAFLAGGFGLLFRRRRFNRTLRKLYPMLILAGLGLASFAVMGCGGGFALPKATPTAQTYTITITGAAGEDTHSTTVSLTVK